jgi:hypothetical protein
MTDRWQRIEKLYHSVRELDESPRKAYLEQACSGDEELRREVESLLSCQPSAEYFIEAPAMEVAARHSGVYPDLGIDAGRVPVYVMLLAASWSRSNFCWVTFRCKRPKGIMRTGRLCRVASVSACQSDHSSWITTHKIS